MDKILRQYRSQRTELSQAIWDSLCLAVCNIDHLPTIPVIDNMTDFIVAGDTGTRQPSIFSNSRGISVNLCKASMTLHTLNND